MTIAWWNVKLFRSLCLASTAAFLALAALARPCSTQHPEQFVKRDFSEDGRQTGFRQPLEYLTYMQMALSTMVLLISVGAIMKMPNPQCCCYVLPYSDAGMCFGTPCCSCANIRQINATMVLIWNVLLICELATGIELLFIYPYLGFFLLHGITFMSAYMLVRGYRRQNAHAHRVRLGLAGAAGANAASPPPPPIHTTSAELVLVLQPDYICYSHEDASLRGSSSCVRGPDQLRGGGARAALHGGGTGCSADVAAPAPQPFPSGGKGYAWALRLTQMDSAQGPVPTSPKMPQQGLPYGTGGVWGVAEDDATPAAAGPATAGAGAAEATAVTEAGGSPTQLPV